MTGLPSGLVALGVAVALVVVVWVTVLCVARVRRLDRLHQRTDAARVGLESALARRAEVGLRVADVLGRPDLRAVALAAGGGAVQGLPRRAEDGIHARELVENALTRSLGGVDRSALPLALLTEIADAEQLVLLARRVHNDAVRDTLGLRSRRLVRWLRLYGTAPLPGYVEIADPPAAAVPPPFAAPTLIVPPTRPDPVG
ncbi:hypothetical protein GCM10009836_09880 [Pseudonocardia ailaonensis]|uniref:NUDIX hydrolase n=1 Tax=Pseudonocardia ailaonensis TaxID=367279 RepID=A0ABN2MNY7_9PSEU